MLPVETRDCRAQHHRVRAVGPPHSHSPRVFSPQRPVISSPHHNPAAIIHTGGRRGSTVLRDRAARPDLVHQLVSFAILTCADSPRRSAGLQARIRPPSRRRVAWQMAAQTVHVVTVRDDSILPIGEQNSLRRSTHLHSKEHVMKQLRSKKARLPVVASCLLGLCLLSGCGPGGSVEPVTASPAKSPQMKRFEELDAKSEAAQKPRQK